MNIRDLKFMLSQWGASGVPDTTEIVIVDAEGYGASPAMPGPSLALYAGTDERGRIYATPEQRKGVGLPAELDADAPDGSELVVFLATTQNDRPDGYTSAAWATAFREAADVIDEAFQGEPFLNYPPDFASLLREKADGAGKEL